MRLGRITGLPSSVIWERLLRLEPESGVSSSIGTLTRKSELGVRGGLARLYFAVGEFGRLLGTDKDSNDSEGRESSIVGGVVVPDRVPDERVPRNGDSSPRFID
eukprot:TRINITY_DN15201_c0_g1_i2.p3 TRINITY_DN15201_c0_g1~~TRINITY_DN15201_c0_g1_i2.p3  ORF type:complete len:104 (-),score=6.36 TRINITY_DN15201_c0_g1_i2:193-504(-)